MKEFAKAFYKSKNWQNCRDTVYRRAGGLCEMCYQKGIIRPGEVVHHTIELTPENINDPDISLNPDRLVLICRECHAEVHDRKKRRRYRVDELGRVSLP